MVWVRLLSGRSTVRPTASPSMTARVTPTSTISQRAMARLCSSWLTPVSGVVICSAPPCVSSTKGETPFKMPSL